MVTKIEITGQPKGNFLLFNALNSYQVVEVNEHFNNYTLVFNNKKDAVNALKNAIKTFNSAREEGEKKYGHMTSLSLVYDASQARIIK